MADYTDKIQHWKQQHKSVIKIASEEGVAYFKKPTVQTMHDYQKLEEDDVYEALVFVFNACVLEQKDYDDAFMLSAGKSLLQEVSYINDAIINAETGADDIKKKAALVRHYFHVDPYELAVDEFQKLVAEALWLQDHKNKQLELALANVLVKVFANNPF